MKPKLLFAMIAAVLLAVPAVEAQRGGVSAGGGGRAAAPAGAVHGSGHASGAYRSSSGPIAGIRAPSATRPRANPFSVYGVPTPYRFGTGNNLGIRVPNSFAGFRNGSGHTGDHRRHRDGYPGFYILDGGGYWYGPDIGDDSGSQQAIGQQDASQPGDDQSGDNGQRGMRAEQNFAPAQQQVEAAPLPDVGSYTLILHDGSQVDAIAFTRSHDNVVYITPEGGRRTIAIREIDVDSTLQVNEDRGTPLRSPL